MVGFVSHRGQFEFLSFRATTFKPIGLKMSQTGGGPVCVRDRPGTRVEAWEGTPRQCTSPTVGVLWWEPPMPVGITRRVHATPTAEQPGPAKKAPPRSGCH